MQIIEVMTRQVQTCQTSDPVEKAAKIMEQGNVGAVPIVDQAGRLTGIMTDRDIVLRGVAKNKDLRMTTCEELMTGEVKCCEPHTEIHEAANMLAQHQIRRLPVVDNQGRLVGICAIGDLAVRDIYINESGEALNQISKGSGTIQ
ncbi:CBS domain-containing protein [Paenibacillus uliginis N3/975]|uniref:CBS domain-containing protein n=1 Tax=Paenibacillus uliginis N3/975 TaxID=1313296 RepID=A0A1X7HTH2_9BACL|nr:CBS domain-containing protein [Paenibacillus uliginis]SMF92415.1 CBS domain-containing protein [Paenibacillus uliginis N3/975]